MEGGLLKFATSFLFLLGFLCWLEVTGKDSVGAVPLHLPPHSAVPMGAGMSAPSPRHLGNSLGCCETPAAHAVTSVIVTLVQTRAAECSLFSFGVGFLNASFLRSLLI